MKTVLTGIKPTGTPHIGNWAGAIRPALDLASAKDTRSLLFIADYHALTSQPSADELSELTYDVAATWLALGLDPKKTVIYRQSDVPEVFEMAWILSCYTSKGLMNRAHAYKAIVAANKEAREDVDLGVNMGLYSYPVLMASDILTFDSDEVPVGEDQVQHIEIARDIAERINHKYKTEVLRIPDAVVQKEVAAIPGMDGRKMSKSYNNTIPIFLDSKPLRKKIMKITTDSSPPEEPKDPKASQIFALYKLFANQDEVKALAERYQSGIGWGEAKQALFEVADRTFAEPRAKYNAFMNDKSQLDSILKDGAQQAREIAGQVLLRARKAIGIFR